MLFTRIRTILPVANLAETSVESKLGWSLWGERGEGLSKQTSIRMENILYCFNLIGWVCCLIPVIEVLTHNYQENKWCVCVCVWVCFQQQIMMMVCWGVSSWNRLLVSKQILSTLGEIVCACLVQFRTYVTTLMRVFRYSLIQFWD